MSLLTLISEACNRLSITSPNQVVGNTDDKIIKLLALANEEGEELSERHNWSAMVSEATHSTLAAELQGVMATIATGFKFILPDTMWNRTTNRKIWPVNGVEWQAYQSQNLAGPNAFFRLRAGNLYIIPTPTASQTVAFEYMSKNWCESSAGTDRSAWAADTDVGILDEQLMRSGIIWRWKRSNGLDYAEDFNQYELRVANAITRDGAKKRINFGRPSSILGSNANVSEGSWTI